MGNAAAPGQGINAFLREQRIEIVDVLFRKGTCRAFRKGRRKSARTQSMTSITSGGKPHTAVNCFFHQSGRRDFVHKSEGDFDDLLRFRAGKSVTDESLLRCVLSAQS